MTSCSWDYNGVTAFIIDFSIGSLVNVIIALDCPSGGASIWLLKKTFITWQKILVFLFQVIAHALLARTLFTCTMIIPSVRLPNSKFTTSYVISNRMCTDTLTQWLFLSNIIIVTFRASQIYLTLLFLTWPS